MTRNNIISFLLSFKYAIRGVFFAVKSQRNMQVHLTIGTIMIMIGMYLQLSKIEWLFLMISIFIVIITECINTSIEHTVDLITTDIHPLAMKAKDIAAGSVLLAAVLATVVGGLIFLPKFKGVFIGS